MNRILLISLALLCSTVYLRAESHVDARLVSDQATISAETGFRVGVHLKMSDHWHTYWENPGSSGLPTEVEWDLPKGLTIKNLQFPVPKTFVDEAEFVTYGYDEEALLIADAIYKPEGDAATTVTIKGKVSWLECNQICLPGSQDVELTLSVGATKPSDDNGLFNKFAKLLPRPYGPDAPFSYATKFNIGEARWDAQLNLKPNEGLDIRFSEFWPGFFQSADMLESKQNKEGFALSWEPYGDVDLASLQLSGIVAVRAEKETTYYRLPIYPEVTASSKGATPPPTEQSSSSGTPGFVYILLLAFIGGLILNLMPCVLPVLSLKVFSIINEAGESAARRIQFGWVYTLGILVSFAILAAFLIVAKAGGEAVGIGFQFQNPPFVVGMICLIFVMGLSFVGVFEITAPQSQKIQGLAQKSGLLGAFYQGGLMTLLSTPCTAPGLGVAYGWAVTAETWQILVIFEVIALGLASPYLVLCYSPALLKFLPKPGAWMDSFKVVMGFLLFATVIWLMNTLMNLSGITSVTGTLTLLLFLSCAAWVHGRSWFSGSRGKGIVINILLIIAGVYLGMFKLFDIKDPMSAKNDYEDSLRLKFLSQAGENGDSQSLIEELESRKTTAEKIAWIPYAPKVLDHFRQQGRIVFLDFTAEWCATCKVNEKLVINTPDIRKALAENDIVTMKVDFTDKDPEILAFIHSFQRAGVPIYAFYPGANDPVVLPETITKGMVLDGISQAKEQL